MADTPGIIVAILVVAFLGQATSMTLSTIPAGINGDAKMLVTLLILLVGALTYDSVRS